MNSNAHWQDRKAESIAQGLSNVYPHFIARARNAECWDIEDNHFIDFGTGIAVCNTGHSHPRVVEAVKAQLDAFSHTCFMVNPYPQAVLLAEKLNQLVPGPTPKKTTFATTGAEAIENAIKIARAYTKRRGVIAFGGGFHGRTNLAMGLTGKVNPYKKDFGPFPADIYHMPFPCRGTSESQSLASFDHLLKTCIDASDVAAVVIEPIQGEGGFYGAPEEFLQALRARCDAHGILLVIDEIQTGFGRTGTLFHSEKSGVEADLMTLAKGIAGGFPLSAVVGKADVMDAAQSGGLGGTYAASPIGCAAALAVLDLIETEQLVERANIIGANFKEKLSSLADRYPEVIGDVRVYGAMIALELITDRVTQAPNQALVKKLINQAPEVGLILLSCGFNGNVIRFLPALTIEDDVLFEGLDRFDRLFTSQL